ncbi:MAG: twin-arginine translocation signal domain-containing protein, partial [Rhodoblastus sp.]|nr:twin-arginine translocation signal domain-containing protein [Rhodoblastus sp.]
MSAETKSQGMLVQTRRDALKTSAIAAAGGAAGLAAPVDATAQTG